MTDLAPPKPLELPPGLAVDQMPGEHLTTSCTRASLRPEIQAAQSLAPIEDQLAWGRSVIQNKHFPSVASVLTEEVRTVNGGDLSRMEAMLVSQAYVLDGTFNDLMRRARMNVGTYPDAAETYMRLAFKAQSQCRSAVEALAEMKAPRAVAFVKQANVAAGHMQVNNNRRSRGRARKKKVEERTNGSGAARLVSRAKGSTGAGHSPLAPVVEIDRSKIRRGKRALEPEPPAARSVQP